MVQKKQFKTISDRARDYANTRDSDNALVVRQSYEAGARDILTEIRSLIPPNYYFEKIEAENILDKIESRISELFGF